MTNSYVLGQNPIWLFADIDATLLSGGRMYTKKDNARSTYKPIYQDIGGVNPYPQPLVLDSSGSSNPIYWMDDEPYYIEIYRKDTSPTSGNPIRVIEHYVPASGGGSPPVTVNQDFTNFVENPDLRLFYRQKWENKELIPPDVAVAPRWDFVRNNDTGNYTFELVEFPPGQTDITEGNPKYYMRISCSSVGGGMTELELLYNFKGVEQFQNTPISFGIQAASSTLDRVEVYLTQVFGSGGSPSSTVTTQILDTVLTATFQKYVTNNIILPSIGGKTLGTDNNDRLILTIRFPLASTFTIDLSNVQLCEGTTLPLYEYLTTEKKEISKKALDLPEVIPGIDEQGKVLTRSANLYNPYENILAVPPGCVMSYMGVKTSVPAGWYVCEGQPVFRWAHNRLYNSILDWYGKRGLEAALGTGDVVTTVLENGNVTDASDISSGLTITVTQQGTPSLPEKTRIVTKAANLIPNGGSFLIHSKDTSYSTFTVYFNKNFSNYVPPISGHTVMVSILDTDDAQEVAEKLYDALNPVLFNIPDLRGYFIRVVDDGAGRDPNVSTRIPNPGGLVENHPGTTQTTELLEHNHITDLQFHFNSSDGPQTRIDPYTTYPGTATTLTSRNSGGAESRPPNIYAYAIMKY